MGAVPAGFRKAASARFVVISGLSGSGKGTVLRALEDAGYYTVDNLPVELIQAFLDSGAWRKSPRGVAAVVDIREGGMLRDFPRVFREIRRSEPAVLVYLEASDEVLLRRYSETRRPHPARAGTVSESLKAERLLLAPIRALADVELDTSSFNVHDLRRKALGIFLKTDTATDLRVTVGSFGFKYGPPLDGDLVLDVRFLPNPNYEPGCRNLTGRDAAVSAFLESYPETGELLRRVNDLLDFVLPRYSAEGKSYLSIYFGCTGGRHRSVYIAEAVAARFRQAGRAARLQHRDIDKDY